jgi:hypothetical protein
MRSLPGIGAVAITIWPALVARRNARTVTTVFVALLAWTVIETQHGNALGLAERLSAAAPNCWLFVVAVAARRAMRAEAGIACKAFTIRVPRDDVHRVELVARVQGISVR